MIEVVYSISSLTEGTDMLFTQDELEQLHNEAWRTDVVLDSDMFRYDSAVARSEPHRIWRDGKSSTVFENNHGCWDIYPTIN